MLQENQTAIEDFGAFIANLEGGKCPVVTSDNTDEGLIATTVKRIDATIEAYQKGETKKQHLVKKDSQGTYRFCLKYGTEPVLLRDGDDKKNSFWLGPVAKEQVVPTLTGLRNSVEAGKYTAVIRDAYNRRCNV